MRHLFLAFKFESPGCHFSDEANLGIVILKDSERDFMIWKVVATDVEKYGLGCVGRGTLVVFDEVNTLDIRSMYEGVVIGSTAVFVTRPFWSGTSVSHVRPG